MADLLSQIANTPIGRRIVEGVGLPSPAPLVRHEPGRPVVSGPVLAGGERGGRLLKPAKAVLKALGAQVLTAPPADGEERPAALVFDASGIADSARLRALYDFFHPSIRALAPNGRVIVLATPPEACEDPRTATAQRAVEGFVRSVAKEVGGRGATAQAVYVAPRGEGATESTLRFLLSARSAYVSGQAIRIEATDAARVVAPADWDRPLEAKVAVVTGSARGIGAAIAEVLARDGAHVVCLDVPAQGQALDEVANRVGGTKVQLDVTDPTAGATLSETLRERHGGVDVVVHNAGITRDKTLGRMGEEQWDLLLDVNLGSQERIDDALLAGDVLRPGGRIVSVSSVSGIAGNRGQSNYAASKAGIIGRVAAMAAPMRERSATINAVAPGFIETAMTDAMPFATREAGRRLNSLAQGGRPVDVAEAIAWLASPASSGVNGNVVRVCGQSLIGA
jgi:3-oxoacyl-[acyl-carrier protein] reductase